MALRVQKYPKTGYVFCNGEDRVPIPNDGKVLDDKSHYRSIFSAVDGETMKVAWQIMVDGNLDNVDADYQGKYAFSTCYNSEEGVNLAEMMEAEQDWVVVFNLKRNRGGGCPRRLHRDGRGAGSRWAQGLAVHPLHPDLQRPARHEHRA
jgi:nitrous oxide reductase